MKLGSYMTVMAVLASVAATPVLADPGNGKGNGRGHKGGEHRRGEVNHHRNVVVVGHCPPGLAKKDHACVPPGLIFMTGVKAPRALSPVGSTASPM